jgi:hypothetical protein
MHHPAPPEDSPAVGQPVAPSNPSHPTLTKVPDIPAPGGGGADHSQGSSPKMTQEEQMWRERIRVMSRGCRPPPVPPPLGFEVADDLSNLKSALEEHEGSRPKPPRIIVDDELFDLKFAPGMSQAAQEAIILERYAIAMSNHKMIGQMLSEAEAEAKQVLWQLTALQPQLYSAHDNMQRFFNEFLALTEGRASKRIRQTISDCESLAKDAWELDWNEEWVFTEENYKEEERMREIAQARTSGVRAPHSQQIHHR